MTQLNEVIHYVLGFQPYVLLPLIIFVLALVFRLGVGTGFRAALTIGIGFIGIFLVFDYFVGVIHPVILALGSRWGLQQTTLDVGWPPLASMTWSYPWAAVILAILLGINVLLLVARLTRTVDIDIWNYWHVIFLALMVQTVTGNFWLALAAAVVAFVLVLKLAEWSAPAVNKLTGMKGICIPHLSGLAYFPVAVALDALLARIPGLRQWHLSPESLQKRLGLAGEPAVIGLVVGLLLAWAAGYDVKVILETGVKLAAVVFILPKMGAILGGALVPISEGMKAFVSKKFPRLGPTFIGLDVAVMFATPSVMVSTVLLMPLALLLALVLPGVNFIPLGDLTNLLVPMALISAAVRGNLVRSLILGIPAIIANLYIATGLTALWPVIAKATHTHVAASSYTVFLDGGNFWRAWFLNLFSGGWIGWCFVPVGIVVLFVTWKLTRPGTLLGPEA